MATFKCNDPIYTVLRNGKVISNNRTPGDAIEGIAEDATITVPTVLQTCDGGNPDGDLVYLSANNTATINYI